MSSWIIPCNEKYYNHKGAFEKLPIIEWRQNASMQEGDTVYIYVGRPISALLYKCEVLEVDIFEPTIDDAEFYIGSSLKTAKRYMKLKLIERYPETKFDRVSLLENGLKTIQGPSRATEEFIKYLESK